MKHLYKLLFVGAFFIPIYGFLHQTPTPERRSGSMMPRPSTLEGVEGENLLVETLSSKVHETVSIPFLPKPVVTFVTKQAIERLTAEFLQPETLDEMQLILKNNDASTDQRQKLASLIARELNPRIDVPVLDEEQEELLLTEIFKVLLAESSHQQLSRVLRTTDWSMMLDPSQRRELARQISASTDIPLLTEEQEEEVLVLAITKVADTLESVVPPSFAKKLQDPKAFAESKEFVLDKLTEKLSITGLSDEQLRGLLETMLDMWLERYWTGSTWEYLTMPPGEKVKQIKEELKVIRQDTKLKRKLFREEIREQKEARKRLKLQLKETKRQAGWNIFRRIFS